MLKLYVYTVIQCAMRLTTVIRQHGISLFSSELKLNWRPNIATERNRWRAMHSRRRRANVIGADRSVGYNLQQ